MTFEATIWVGSLLGARDPMVSIMRERDKRKHRGPPSQRVGPHLSYMPIIFTKLKISVDDER